MKTILRAGGFDKIRNPMKKSANEFGETPSFALTPGLKKQFPSSFRRQQ
jgi:hypothetical protein